MNIAGRNFGSDNVTPASPNAMAARLAAGLATLPGIRLVQPVEANELFVSMSDNMIKALLTDGFEFYRWAASPGEPGPVVRLVTAFCTTEADVDELIAAARDYAIKCDAPS
jgi:threonine aldolase